MSSSPWGVHEYRVLSYERQEATEYVQAKLVQAEADRMLGFVDSVRKG
jgi:hypothetical protein